MQFNFLGGQHKGFSAKQNAQETVNMFVEVDMTESDNKITLYRVDGKRLEVTLPDAPIYAMAEFRNDVYVAAGSGFYRVTAGFGVTYLGAVTVTVGASISFNNAGQVCLVSNNNGYVYDTVSGSLTPMTDPAFYGSVRVDYLSGYGVFIKPNSQQFYISNLNNFLVFNGLDFASDEADPDNLVSFIVDHIELILFGEKTTTVWFVTDDSTFPLARREGATMEVGCSAAHSVAKMDNTVFFLGKSSYGEGLVYKLNQYTPQIISNRGIEFLINSFDRIDDAFAYTYQKNGHSFYVLTFPDANKTLVYDASIPDPDMAWHVRETYNLGRDRSSCHAFAFGKHLVGDCITGNIYSLDENYHYDGDQPIAWSRTSPHIISDFKRLRHIEVVLNFETGVGLEDGSDPLCYLTYSSDGQEFITPREISMGVIGQRRNRCQTARLGNSRDRVYRVFGSAPVKTVLSGGYIDVKAGNT